MAAAKKGDRDGTLGARFVVILFALAVVAIGLYPLRPQLSSYTRQLRSFTAKNFPVLMGAKKGELERPDSETRENDSRNDIRAMFFGEPEAVVPQKPAHITVEKDAKQLDKLSKKDRKELTDLVNGH